MDQLFAYVVCDHDRLVSVLLQFTRIYTDNELYTI